MHNTNITPFCIDTNILFSFQKDISLGESPSEVAHTLVRVITKGVVVIYTPPRVAEELFTMMREESKASIQELLTHLVVKSPHSHTHTIGAQTLYDFVDENRERMTRGLHIAEDILDQSATEYSTHPIVGKIELQKSLQPLKESLRNRYRNAMRAGFIDSLADLDLIFLALETNSHLITADEGVLWWGRKLGAKEMSPSVFGATIRRLLEKEC